MYLPQTIVSSIKYPHHMAGHYFAKEPKGVDVIFVESMGQWWIDFHVGDMDKEFKESKGK